MLEGKRLVLDSRTKPAALVGQEMTTLPLERTIFRSTGLTDSGVMSIITLALLLAGFGSRIVEPTEAVFVYTPSTVAWARIVRVAEELVFIVPRLQVITDPVCETEAPAGD
jgi:hypothetical protein